MKVVTTAGTVAKLIHKGFATSPSSQAPVSHRLLLLVKSQLVTFNQKAPYRKEGKEGEEKEEKKKKYWDAGMHVSCLQAFWTPEGIWMILY